MTLATYIDAMPKVELHVYLEGAVNRDTLSMIADQNEIPTSMKHFQDWINLVSKPDYKKLYDLIRMTCGWMQTVDDVTRSVYELGVSLHKQHIYYAEVSVNPALYTNLPIPLEDFMTAINDGRDRVKRAWNVDMAWLLTLPRDEPRRGDEIARFVTTASARRFNVLGLGLSGNENAQPVGQFERPFKTVEKKELPRIVRAGDYYQLDGVTKALDVLSPTRLIDGRGAWDSDEIIARLVAGGIPVCISPRRALLHGWTPALKDYPLRKLYDAGVALVIGADMPTFYGTLTAQYHALNEMGFTLNEIEDIALNAVRFSLLPAGEKEALEARFLTERAALRQEHLPQTA